MSSPALPLTVSFDPPITARKAADMMPRTVLLLIFAMPAVFACAPAESQPGLSASPPTNMSASKQRGLAFAQHRCATCHAVASGASPNPEAPSFEAVINAPDLKLATLKPWLQNSHNFPATMDFSIEPGQIDDLAAYMLTLKDPRYRPPIQ